MARLEDISMNCLLMLSCWVWFAQSWCYHKSFTSPSSVNQVSYSPDNGLIVTAGSNNAYIFNAYSYQQVGNYNAGQSSNSAKFSKDQKYIALGLNDDKVPILNGTTFAHIHNISSSLSEVYQIDWSWDNTKLLICGKNNGLEIYNVPAWTLLYSNTSMNDDIMACKFGWNGEFAGGDKDGYIYSFTASNTYRFRHRPNSDPITGLDFSPDGKYFVATDDVGKVYIYNPSVSNTHTNTFTDSSETRSVAYSKDYTYYTTGTGSPKITNWYNGTVGFMTTKVTNFAQTTTHINSVAFSYDSKSFAAGCVDKKVHIYKVTCDANCPVEQYPTGATTCRLCALDLVGCRQCNSSNYCFSCTDGYYLDTVARACKSCVTITACSICSAHNVCLSCIGTYYLNSPTLCSLCWISIPGCISCSNSSTCLACSANSYYLNNSTCTTCQIISGCLYCNSSTTCTYCKPSYFLSTAGSCEHCPFNCSLCSSNTTCMSCDTGYYLSTNSCLACSSICLTCNSTTCFSCTVGYYLSGSSCLQCPVPCSICVNATFCMACLPYSQGPNNGICTNCTNGCASCGTSTMCYSCIIGYYHLNSSMTCNKCTMLADKCQICTNTTCLLCSTQYYQSGGTCLSCSSAMSGCILCSNSTLCNLCQNTYYLNSLTCSQCTFPCVTCNDTTKCLSCALGYYLVPSSSSCLPCSCPTCSSSTACLSCAFGLYLSSGSCLSCNSSIYNCIACFNSTLCSTCTIGFYLNSARTACVACNLGCTSCSGNSTTCSTCDLGFYLVTTTCTRCPYLCATCNSSTVCTECVTGNYLSGNNCNNFCLSLFTGCMHCNSSLCYSCQYRLGYYLNGSQCAQCNATVSNCVLCSNSSTCIACIATYALTSLNTCALCSSFMTDCQFCSNNSTCNLCEIGFYANGSCFACSTQCLACSNSTVCLKCLTNSLLLSNSTCATCFTLIVGCDTCTATNVCTICGFGFYNSAGSCTPCLSTISGCLQCSNSTRCLQCEIGYYLNTTNSCTACNSLILGCLICNYTSNQCLSCQSGFFINSTSQCTLCSDPNCLNCYNSTTCNLCTSGYYLTVGSCSFCTNLFTGCIFCNSSQCLECESGYYLNSSNQCNPCTVNGCQICNNTLSTQCINCNSQYYLSVGQCYSCAIAIPECQLCSSNTICFQCEIGFYVNLNICKICSSIYPNCNNCLATTCLDCNSGFILNSTGCSLCASYISSCSYCSNSTICLNCMVGYYINSNSSCSTCTIIIGCLVCRNSMSCLSCHQSYYLQSGTCILCNTTLTACIACISSTICVACAGDYRLSSSGCQIIVTGQTYYPYPQLKLTSEYVNAATLKHTLWATKSQFNQSSINITNGTALSYLTTGGTTGNLTIQSYEWGPRSTSIIFYTNNPFDFSSSNSYNSIQFFNMRLLAQSQSNLQLNAVFQITMTSSTVSAILPTANHTGALYLNYNINQPEFMASLIQQNSYSYWIFGLIATLYMILFYCARAVVLPKDKTNGSLISHVLYTKCAALAVYPAYAELINYCKGFMLADLPWLNYYFASQLAVPTEIIPSSYRLFYVSLSLASTYLLSIALFVLVGTALLIIQKTSNSRTAGNFCLLLYNFFLSGLIIAGMGCLQGAIYNSISELTLNSVFYIAGIIILLLILVEIVYSLLKDKNNIYRLRILVKGVCLSLLHFSPIYLFAIVVIFQILFLTLEVKLQQKNQPRLWLAINILPTVSLLFIVQLSHSLFSIYLSCILIVLCFVLDFIMLVREFKIVKQYQQLQINSTIFNITNQSILQDFNLQGKSRITLDYKDEPLNQMETFVIEQNPSAKNKRQFYEKTSSVSLSKLPSPNRTDNSLVFNLNQQ